MIIGLCLGAVVGNELLSYHERRGLREEYYNLALARSIELGKPLMVIGDPDSWTKGNVGYGDICIDLNGAPLAPNGVVADITKHIPAKDNSHVVFVSCVLEYVNDIEAAWKEVIRVAGSEWNVFVVHVQDDCLAAGVLINEANYIIHSAPPQSNILEYSLAPDKSFRIHNR